MAGIKLRGVPRLGKSTAALLTLIALAASVAAAQGSRKDDIVFGTTGHPVAGATITVCQATATGTPCSPLATIYTDATLTTAAPNPFQGDGLGNYHFYAPAGRYLIQITGPGISGTQTYPDVILPADVSSTGAGNDISAFGLTLGGNLTVAGNATINGTLSTANFNPGNFAPASLNLTGDETVAGPRPRIDVTAYGAKGDGVTNDTAAIQAAITAACGGAMPDHVPDLFFPAGTYLVSQPQTPSTAPVFTTCSNLHLVGSDTSGGAQFLMPPMTQITASPGSSPNAAPIFQFSYPQNNITVENLVIDGDNQAVGLAGGNNINFNNVCFAAATTGMTDNTPIKIDTSIWDRFRGGCIQVSSGTVPDVILTTSNSSAVQGLAFFNDMIWVGGGVQYIERQAGPPGTPGDDVFHNITLESCAAPFFSIVNSAGTGALPTLALITLDNITMSDCTGNQPLLNFNDPSGVLDGVTITNPAAGNPVVVATAGSLEDLHIQGCPGCAVVDGSGNPIGGASVATAAGGDIVVNATDPARLRSDLFGFAETSGPAFRAAVAGSRFAGIGIDPTAGVLFGDQANYGYNAQVYQSPSSPGTLDIGFAKTLPPTGATATATTGGTMAAGTYYYYVKSANLASNCGVPQYNSAPSLPAQVAISGSNNAATISWTAPPAGAASVVGYCVFRSGDSTWNDGGQIPGAYIAGASTTSATDTGAWTFQGFSGATNAMQSVHRFTATSLGIDNLNPQFNLDVNGTAAVNSLNGVQKAERFTGTDAAAKINACLTAASTTSGVCDARGLTGTLTGASHIAIPAGTTLLWGEAQLTINDATTKDAVELMGDGSSIVGDQESGTGTIPRPDASGYIACGIAGCTAVDNPNAATRNVDWVHITGMDLIATGASSTVVNLTSVGHADIEDNRIALGTGGNSYGIFGDTSTGGFDSTNTLIKHNEFDPQFQGDRCLHLAGVFNVIEMEQNTCILPAANTGTVCFELAKDSNGNYPNNDEFYGNDCEGSSTSFGQIGYNIINADSVTIGPNNRCENVYSCFQFPTDGSAVGIHILDPYISVSANSVVKPNEPSTAQVAIDNNGPNWLPSMHYGINDLAGQNLLGNAGFEGWQNATTLYAWGGVSGVNINQAGSGIYAQQSSATSPADSTTQGSYNVKIGDNATAGLGIDSVCIPVDATMNYTLAFRVAASSTSVNFRPGFRFYSDPNCTEADKITNVATNARVLTPPNYAGYSSIVGSGPNWQSSNASLSYNNGITCNCNVTGSDWQVAAANTWTPTRNFAVTFRVPNAYSSSATVAQSMRVFILENTAANPNTIYVDDAVLSEGPVSPSVPLPAPLADSGNPTVYGNLSVAGTLTVGSQPATLTAGTPAANDCAAFTSGTVTNIQDSGAPCPALFTKYAIGFSSAGEAASSANAVNVSVIYLPSIQFSHLTVDVSTTDSSTSDFYSWAITDASGNVKCSITAVNLTAGGANDQVCTQGTVTLPGGAYIFAFTGNATTAKIAYGGTAPLALSSAVSSSTSSSGAITFPISIPSAGVTYSGYGLPAIILH